MTSEGRGRMSPRATFAVALSWMVFIGLFYFPAWRPLSLLENQLPEVPRDILAAAIRLSSADGVKTLLMLIAGLLAALGAGHAILRLFRLDLDAAQGLTFSAALGLGAFSLATLFIGLMGGFNDTVAGALSVVMLLLAAAGARRAWTAVKAMPPVRRPGGLKLVFLALFAVLGVYLFAKAMRPAVFYDTITYHLGVPNYYLREGGIGYIPSDSFSNFPFMAEMLYTLGMLLSGLKLAQASSVLVFLLTALAVYDFTRTFVKEVNPALPAIFILLTPAFLENSVLYTCDLHLTYYTLLAVYCFFLYERDGDPRLLALMGVFTGVCLGTKYVALASILIPAAAAVAYAAYRQRGRGAGDVVRVAAYFAVPAILVYAPWVVKNLVYTGNPFYPAFHGLLGGADITDLQYRVAAINKPGLKAALTGLWEHPWKLFMAGPAEATLRYHAASYLGPLALALTPPLLMVRDISPAVKRLCLVSLALFILWDAAFPLTRYLYPAVAMLLIIAAYATSRLGGILGRYEMTALTTGAVFILAVQLSLGFFLVNDWTASSGLAGVSETDDAYLLRRSVPKGNVVLTSFPAYKYINENSDRDARVLVIGDAQHLYIDRRHMYTYLSARAPYDIFREKAGDQEAVYAWLKSEGVTHIVYNPAEMARLQKLGYIAYPAKDNRYIRDFLSGGRVTRLLAYGSAKAPVFVFGVR
ncbi:MAG: glycosyltransferase family 39 protein [Nitrospirae bacterium]|nr:glycosyltransferase family 39 protein [Nitrospirota bacterium]